MSAVTSQSLSTALTVISANIEGLTAAKASILSEMCKRECCHCLCLQETHRSTNLPRPKIAGMSLVVERPHSKYGSAILIRNDLKVKKIYERVQGTVELITIVMPGVVVHSVYKPPNDPFELPALGHRNLPHIVIGDFNSHSTTWGYTNTDNEGEAVEQWADSCDFTLIHDAKLPKSFNSARPDLIVASESIANMCKKSVMDPIPHTQHRPICVSVQPVVVPQPTPFRRRFNFRKADWNGYSTELDNSIEDVEPIPSNYNRFVENVRVASRRHIPRGCRTDYVQGLTDKSKNLYEAYKQQYSSNPFDNRTMESGNLLLDKMTEEKRKIWEEVITSINMTHNSRKAWKTINKLSNDPTSSNPPCLVTANQVAHQLLVNGRGTMPSKPKRPVLPSATEGDTSKVYPFSEGEYNKGVAALKNNKAAGRDDILVEQLKHLGPKAHKWLLTMLNICFMENKIPTIWRQSKIIAILKPGKDSSTHIHNTKMKVATRNNLLKKLANSRWGTNARTIRTTALALCYSTAEYAAPVWERSAYAHLLNPELNQACRAITGCLRPTNVENLYLLAGIAPPEIRRSVCARVERTKQVERETHSLFGHTPARRRLKSRRSFLTSVQPVHFPAKVVRVNEWKRRLEEKAHAGLVNLYEDLATGHDRPWLIWRCLNRLRTGYTCSKEQRKKWGYFNGDTTCECGLATENTSHMLQCTLLAHPCTMDDLLEFNDSAQACIERWKKIA